MSELKEGDKAPDFPELVKHRGKTVVLYFYPRDNTPGCTIEACEFRDEHKNFAKKNAVVLGVSTDSADSHEKFSKKFNLPFELVPDPDKKIVTAYGVWKPKKFMGREFLGTLRTTFLIGADGRIQKIWRNVKARGHAAEVLAAL
jgi:peroxiredoxin Q/BCP